MNAIKQIRKYLEKDSQSEGAKILARLTAALAEEGQFSLADLYKLDYETFNLAIDLLKDWRLDRYYAARIRLFDVVLNQTQVEPEGAAATAPTAVTH
jgi:ATP-dependent protease HslVU (ClpYQ) peptidase subunit